VLFVLKHAQLDMSLLFGELIHTQQEVKLFGPAFSTPAIWSVIFHFPGPAFFQVLHFQSTAQRKREGGGSDSDRQTD